MARRLRPVRLDFLESAPLRLVFAAHVAAPPSAVYRALADEVADSPSWFPAIAAARPIAGGAGREIRLRGGVVFQERILVTDAGERYAYRVEETNAPGVRALMEEWLLTPVPEGPGTRVRWTMAAEGTAPFRVVMRLGRSGVGRSFRDAMRNLDRRLASSPAP
ncbi:SRPBCC family protein [Streptomyces sp. WAC05374]|uniref:SRPBCC family protein n=1 Tax=Streptomyces sp. WAC05374 TaxID=2487420 RepID=UPI000F878A33|nr:SRPBCC family protein [Streptomyces sp. WAC05374]RST06341.1 SRPBCC family protein [Streptomyces sp. WAC05374]TDF50602.1 SRPBCC family protein [Streptomyces sp. WAC05374]TDF56892.1 SRPBCC family protein [Streptomyces sp. WAC05374]TDF60855.1 SRPBCC family protein [Streptomyces sp. WAC05374]